MHSAAETKSTSTVALQDSMHLFEKINPGTSIYHRITAVELKGTLDIKKLEKALQKLTQRHEALRSAFIEDKDGRIQQVFSDEIEQPLIKLDATSHHFEDTSLKNMLNTLKEMNQEKLFSESFTLNKAPLWRSVLIRLNENHYQLALVFHHIIVDLVSEAIILQDLTVLYNQKDDAICTLPKIPSLLEFTQSEKKLTENISYWKKKLENLTPLSLKPDQSPKEKLNLNGDRIELELDEKSLSALKNLAGKQQASLHMILLASLYTLLFQYTDQTDICIGTVSANRRHDGFDSKNIVGCLINSIPLRAQISDGMTFTQLLQQVKEIAVEAYKFQAPLDRISREALQFNKSVTTPFNVMLALNVKKTIDLKFEGVEASLPVEPNLYHSRFHLGFNIDELCDSLRGHIEYNTDLFSRDFILRIQKHFINLLKNIIQNPESKLTDLALITEEEYKQIVAFNNTEKPHETKEFIHELFSKRAKENPEGRAFVFHSEDKESKSLTYSQADAVSDDLAALLNSYEIKPEIPVGICLTRSLNLMNAFLATFKSGGAALPLETKSENIELIYHKLHHTDSRYVFVDNQTKPLFEKYKEKITLINLDELDFILENIKKSKLSYKKPIIHDHDLAYIIYTSGTTGTPKGVEITHGNLLNLINSFADREFKDSNKILLTAPPTFDAFFFEFLSALCTRNNELHFICDELRLSIPKITAVIKEEKISFATLTPNIIDQIDPKETPSLELISMGAPPSEDMMHKWGHHIQNNYGPTETTIDATMKSLVSECPSTCIGVPLRNFQIYILNNHGQICPPGTAGKIYISGAGVARGYTKDTQRTSEKFIYRKFNSDKFRFESIPEFKTDSPSFRFYDTGDIGTYLAKENKIYGINLLGRTDRQIKIMNGVRIELDGLEAILRNHPEIKDVAVIQDTSKKNLLAYVIPKKKNSILFAKHLNSFFNQTTLLSVVRLQGVTTLETLPLNSNGKVDTKLLPEYKFDPSEIEAPKTELQSKLRAIWASALNLPEENFGIDQSYSEIGGDSLRLPKITALINNEYPKIDVKIREIFPNLNVTIIDMEKYLTPLLNKVKMTSSEEKALEESKLIRVASDPAVLTPSSLKARKPFWTKKNQEPDLNVISDTKNIATSST